VGLDAVQALGVLTNAAPGSPLLKTIATRLSGKQYETQFATRLMEKDLRYETRMSQSVGLELNNCRTGFQVVPRCRITWSRRAGHGVRS
jgi:3-hydroxyisobutyrate dehydrogenase-like beta-hydroxyacid dehydrogenase